MSRNNSIPDDIIWVEKDMVLSRGHCCGIKLIRVDFKDSSAYKTMNYVDDSGKKNENQAENLMAELINDLMDDNRDLYCG
uniref:Uncharacterized protein n=1 Tax=Panagrolaimus sp. JU765 TaxID=591449 RepID=A0AC34QCK3_9BILA